MGQEPVALLAIDRGPLIQTMLQEIAPQEPMEPLRRRLGLCLTAATSRKTEVAQDRKLRPTIYHAESQKKMDSHPDQRHHSILNIAPRLWRRSPAIRRLCNQIQERQCKKVFHHTRLPPVHICHHHPGNHTYTKRAEALLSEVTPRISGWIHGPEGADHQAMKHHSHTCSYYIQYCTYFVQHLSEGQNRANAWIGCLGSGFLTQSQF